MLAPSALCGVVSVTVPEGSRSCMRVKRKLARFSDAPVSVKAKRPLSVVVAPLVVAPVIAPLPSVISDGDSMTLVPPSVCVMITPAVSLS